MESDYREILKEELAMRCHRNPRYSLRSFARDLDMAPARLSDVLRKRYGISKRAALQISKKLSWDQIETQHFCDLVESEHSRSFQFRAAARLRLGQRLDGKAIIPSESHLTNEQFQSVCEWYHLAILELMELKDFHFELRWISQRLDISEHVVSAAIERLKKVGLLIVDKNGQWNPARSFTTVASAVPSESIRRFHKQVLEKSESALYFQELEERDFSSLILALDAEHIGEAKKMIQKFRNEFNLRFGQGVTKNQVYCLSVQLFRLDKKRGNL